MQDDVVVVGAGPAGLYAAQLLARQGLTVRILEEHDRVGEPVHCTGILGVEAFRLPWVPQDAVLRLASEARFHSPAGHCLSYTGPPCEVCIIDRGVFDRSLAAGAVAAGARLVSNARVVALAAERAGVQVQTLIAGRPYVLDARVCLLACGAKYRLQRSLGWGTPPFFLSSAQTELTGADGQEVEVFFRPEVLPAGFAWLVPLDRAGKPRAKVGVMAEKRAHGLLDRFLDELITGGRVSGQPDPVVVRLLPLGPLSRTHGDRTLAIGDAAGLVKPTTGGGIYYSLLSAQWAVSTLVEAFQRGDFSAATLRSYEKTWRARLGRELNVGTWFRRLAQRLTAEDLDALTKLAINDGLKPIIDATARFNWHHELIVQAIRHPSVLQILSRRLWGAAASA